MSDIPKLRFKEFSGEWENKTLGDVSNNVLYGVGCAATTYDGVNKYLRITDIDESSRTFVPNPLTSPDGLIEEKYKLIKGDIVFARTGASTGKSYLYNERDGNLIYAGFLIKFHINKADPYFVYANTFKEHYNKWVQVMSIRSGQPGINAEEYKRLPLLLPTKPEQQKIASFLTSVDKKIELLTQKEKLLKDYKKGIMQKIFSQEIRFKADDGSEFPAWEEKVFNEIFERITSKNKENNLNVLTISAQQGLINQETYFNKSVSAKDLSGYYLLYKDDFAYNKSYSNGYPLGAIKRLKKYNRGVVSTLYICFRTKNNNVSFLEHYFDNGGLNKEIHKIAQEGARNHGLLNISVVEFFNDIHISIPCSEEQTKIANFLSAVDSKIELATKQLEDTKEFKKGLLQQMFV
ncbi:MULTISPECIES: restriction endonuclease subunit S [unclassified Francisella]|uniref:restriction endonuclease subunit S n=1 Tax=unclassified Francisella TaxID=2610885 RepID=UPI002E3042AE|nr:MULTISPECIES: restriction endonuclease subunit S [unclassified Francisella]MED7818422.1 restriction endonuclease subunit S [Francisella sp. 19S2-4]MED7829323.1 restriction endonuclease subunit S [Francisella sp. 19S2-10]